MIGFCSKLKSTKETRRCHLHFFGEGIGFLAVVLISSAVSHQGKQSAEIHGQIIGAFGLPIERASMTVYSAGKVIANIITDKNGYFSFEVPYGGNVRIQVTAEGYLRIKKDLEVTQGEKLALDLYMKTGTYSEPITHKIEGMVSQSNKRPLPDARVSLINPFNQEVVQKTRTNRDGRYSFSVYGGQFIVFAHKPGYIGEARTIIHLKDQSLNFSLKELRLK